MKTLSKIVALSLFLLFIITGCKKDAGPIGPQGPKGADGNANVYGYKFVADLANFTFSSSVNEYYIFVNPATISGGAVTIGDKDAVLLYLFRETIAGVDYYEQLPYDDFYGTSGMFNHHHFEVGTSASSNNNICITIRNSTGVAPYTPMTGYLYYKLVIIKSSNLVKPTLPKDLSYESIKTHYNLKD